MMALARIAAALIAGAIFGFGLSLSGMLDPARVRGFLDVAGDWNPSLAVVLGGAVAASAVGQAVSRRLEAPLFERGFAWPRTHPIDARLIVGSALFGIGWGMAGLCPGPAVATLTLGLLPTAVFVAAMVAGMLLFRLLPASSPQPGQPVRPSSAPPPTSRAGPSQLDEVALAFRPTAGTPAPDDP